VIRTTVFRRRASEPCHARSANPATRIEISTKIDADLGMPVDALYALVIADRGKRQGFADLHFIPAGSQLMGQHIAADIGVPQPIAVS
jgi:hypothetical protein